MGSLDSLDANIRFPCPGCGSRIRLPPNAGGRKCRCVRCGTVSTVPPAGTALSSQVPAGEGPPDASAGVLTNLPGGQMVTCSICSALCVSTRARRELGGEWVCDECRALHLAPKVPASRKRRWVGLGVATIVIALAATVYLCWPMSAVIGVKHAHLYRDRDLHQEMNQVLAAGTQVRVLEMDDHVAKISAGNVSGWVERYTLCRGTDYEKRVAAGSIPDMTIRLGYGSDGFYFTGGEISIVHGNPTLCPGQGMWCDPSTAGRKFSVGDKELECKPNTLYFLTEHGEIVELPIR